MACEPSVGVPLALKQTIPLVKNGWQSNCIEGADGVRLKDFLCNRCCSDGVTDGCDVTFRVATRIC
jgi:hypothetical protein